MPTLFGIKNCDSVKKARKWLDSNSVDYVFHDFRVDGLDESMVNRWLAHSDWNTLLNRRSTSWKQLSETQRESVTENTVAQLLVEVPTLVKRPVLEHDKGVLIGFKENEYTATCL